MTQVSGLIGFLPARLDYVRRCPARAQYLELCFSTEGGPWNWCFPEPDELPEAETSRTSGTSGMTGPLALKASRYGVQAHPIDGGDLGPALPSSTALPMILAGAEVHIADQLVSAIR